MQARIRFILVVLAVLLGGCAAPPQQPVHLTKDTLTSNSRIGVAMAPLPAVDMHLVGANCLTCLEIASAANAPLTTHAHTLPSSDLSKLKDEAARLLRARGANVTVIADDIDVGALSNYAAIGSNTPLKDYSGLQSKYQVDKLLVINIAALGFIRTYAAYEPTSEPKALFEGAAYIVNLSNNTYEWYEPIKLTLTAGSGWDEPPQFPSLTRAYFQLLQTGKEKLLKPLGGTATGPGH